MKRLIALLLFPVVCQAAMIPISPEATLESMRSVVNEPIAFKGGHQSEQMSRYFLLGNGAIGTSISSPDGSPEKLRFWLNRNDFWRDHLMEGKKMKDPAEKARVDGHYVPTRTVNANPGVLDVQFPGMAGAKFAQALDFYRAELTTTLSTEAGRVVVVSSMPKNGPDILVQRVRNAGATPVVVRAISIAPQTRKPNAFYYDIAAGSHGKADDVIAWVTRRTPLGEPIKAHPDEPSQFRTWAAVGTRVFGGVDLKSVVDDKWDVPAGKTEVSSALEFSIPPGAEATIVTAIKAGEIPLKLSADPTNPLEKTIKLLQDTNQAGIAKISKENIEWWASYWNKARIQLPDESMIEQTYYGSLYVFGISNRPGDYTSGCNSFGVEDGPMWTGDYHWNYNIEAPYYLVGSADRNDLIAPFDLAVKEHDEKLGRKLAEMAGQAGTFFCIGTAPGGQVNEGVGGYGHRTNAVEAAIVQLDNWAYGRDLAWAKSVYPFLRQVALYWDGDLPKHKEVIEGGAYRYNITDNAPLEGVGGGPKGPKQNLNATPAIGMLQRFYQLMIPLTQELNGSGFATGFSDKDIALWRDIRDHLPAYPTTFADGRKLFLWSEGDPDPYTVGGWHWNLLQVYPCHQISLSSNPDLIQTALNSYYMRPELFLRGSPNTEWYGIGARLGNYPPETLERLNWYIRRSMSPTHVVTQGGNLECVAIVDQVNNFLLQSQEGFLRFFPAYHHREAAFQDLGAEGGFLVTAQKTEGIARDISILSRHGLPCAILNPWPDRNVLVTTGGQQVPAKIEQKPFGQLVRFETKPGESYEIAPEGGYPVAQPFPNVALGAKVSATSEADSSKPEQKPVFVHPKNVPPGIGQKPEVWRAANLTDGNRRFQSLLNENMGWSSVPTENPNHHEAVTVDLGKVISIRQADLWPMTRGDMRYARYDKENVAMDHSYNGFPLDFTIQVSSDGQTWKTVAAKKDYLVMGKPDQKPKDALGPESFAFAPTLARYLKVDMTKLRKSRYFEKFTAGFAEIEVMRTP